MRKAALAAGGFALVLALAGCGGNSIEGSATTFGSAQELVRAAKTGTQQTQTAKFSLDAAMAGQTVKATGEGRFDSANPAMSMRMEVAGQSTMEMRFVDKVMYLKMPQQQGDKPWMKVSADGTDPMSRMMSSQFDQMAKQMDVSKALEQIQAAGTIKSSEQVELDGQPATHYVIELDFAKLMEQQGPGGMAGKLGEQAAGKIDTLPMELWVNEQQLPLQIVMDMTKVMEAAGAPAGQSGGKMTMKYTDWGAPVDVQAPPADQVGEFKMPR